MGEPILDPLNVQLPEGLQAQMRNVYVAPGKMSTFRFMHDAFDPNRDHWFKTDGNMPRVTDGNEVRFLIRGGETYQDMVGRMVEAIRSKPQEGDPAFIYLLGWNLDSNALGTMEMIPGNKTTVLKKILTAAAAQRIEIRAMVWSNLATTPFSPTFPQFTVPEINQLLTGRGIEDWKTAIFWTPPGTNFQFHVGSHHQKVLIVRAAHGRVTAYLGGIDLDITRLDEPAVKSKGPGWQDVHCRIRGPAADDVLDTFRERWGDYLNGSDHDWNHDKYKPAFDRQMKNRLNLEGLRASTSIDQEPYRQSVQICRTFHSKLYDRIPPGRLAGERTIRDMVKHSIARAEQFIYIEDQYLFNIEISNELKKALAKGSFRWLIILIPPDGAVDGEVGGQGGYRRSLFLDNLRNAPGGEKVHVFAHKTRYVHSKIYIIDDKLAIIGSANCNRRGMEHDSEIAAAIFDRASNRSEALHLARRLRMKLFATHLNLGHQADDPNSPANTQLEYAEMADGIGSAAHWIRLPPSARVVPYQGSANLTNAIAGLKAEKKKRLDDVAATDKLPASVKLAILPPLTILLDGLFPENQTGVEVMWNQLFDPADP